MMTNIVRRYVFDSYFEEMPDDNEPTGESADIDFKRAQLGFDGAGLDFALNVFADLDDKLQGLVGDDESSANKLLVLLVARNWSPEYRSTYGDDLAFSRQYRLYDIAGKKFTKCSKEDVTT